MVKLFFFLFTVYFLYDPWPYMNSKQLEHQQHEHSARHLFMCSTDTGMCLFEMLTQNMTNVYILCF